MKICVAQTKPKKGDIPANIENHAKWIQRAVAAKADLIVFPELSLTGYEPELAQELATDAEDSRLDLLQQMSDADQITLGVGLPTKAAAGICISMVILSPNEPRRTYSKQLLHADELPYFVPGNEQVMLNLSGVKIAPAICYESLQPEHAQHAHALGAELYLASVAKSQRGIDKACAHFPSLAKTYSLPVLMANAVGYCDNFESAGQTAGWNKNGTLIGKLRHDTEGILLFDTETEGVMSEENVPQ